MTVTTDHGWLTHVCAPTEMGRLVAAFDWASTPLGAPSTWSAGLRAATSLCLTSRFPMLVVWGPELIQIYNDGYRPMLGDKHANALGRPASAVWSEVWDVVGPMFESVMTTAVPTWEECQSLIIDRHGYAEECFFQYSYSPIYDDDGTVGGVLDVVTETTAAVIAARRLRCLAALGASVSGDGDITDACARAVDTLGRWRPDITGAAIHLTIDGTLTTVASKREPGAPSLSLDRLAAVESSWRSDRLEGESGLVHQVAEPIGLRGAGVRGVLVLDLDRRRAFDADYEEFTALVAGTVSGAIESEFQRALELGEYRRIADTLQSAMLAPASDIPTVAARYVPALGRLAVGGDWYDVIELSPNTRALVVGDCVGHGLEAAAAMSQLRIAARSMLFDGRDPAGVLDGLHRYAESVEGAECATVVCAIVDRNNSVITYSRAGHLPPLVIGTGASGNRWLDGAGGPPLAAIRDCKYENESAALLTGDRLLLFSDGLVERRDETIVEGLDRLQTVADAAKDLPIHDFADHILRTLRPDGGADDIVLVAKLNR